MINSTQTLCESTAGYDEEPGYRNNETIRANMGQNNQAARNHISSMTQCKMSVSHLSSDQEWKVVGKYDYDKYTGNSNAGKQAEVSD
jgi:exo-beta-1,3-glucanase (GH17 family)